jgi:DNA mismatch repair ATPase MutL
MCIMKKRAIVILLTTIMLGGLLSACGNNNNATPIPTATSEASHSSEASPSADADASPSEGASPSEEASPSSEASSSVDTAPSQSPEPSKEPAEPSKKPAEPSKEPAPSKKPTAPDKKPTPSKEPDSSKAPSPATKDIVDEMLKQVEQPSLMEMSGDQVKEAYGIDMALLEDYAVHVPLMNVKTNEIAIFKVKKPTDIAAVKKGIETRAENVQKQFEHYLQDQYENAKNYRLVTKGNYVLFLISESADALEKAFNDSFNK